MIEIDGSQGEGGGQVLRSALTLSILSQQPVRIFNIRQNRSKPGLQAQHLQAVKAAAKISRAEMEGAQLHSREIWFTPGPVRSGRYRFEIGTAGSTSLVLQTIFLPLSLAKGASQVTVLGGTHVPFSPSFHYLDLNWLPWMQQTGLQASLNLEQAGFYPGGGGEIRSSIRQVEPPLAPLVRLEPGALVRIRGISGVANLEVEIARRLKLQVLRRLESLHRDSKIQTVELPGPGKGAFICLVAEFEHTRCCYCSLGAPDKRAERVADEAVDALEAFLRTPATVDEYLADQLLLPLAFAAGTSQFRTPRVTRHLLTQAEMIQRFVPVTIRVEGEAGEAGLVTVIGSDLC